MIKINSPVKIKPILLPSQTVINKILSFSLSFNSKKDFSKN